MTEPATAEDQTPEDDSRVAELEQKLAEATDKMLRALAEADNVRKRTVRDKEDTAKYAVSSFARELLTVADNLSRALAAVTQDQRAADPALNNLCVGIEMTARALAKALEAQGIKKVEPLGQTFDANLHEVIFETDTSDAAPGTVTQVIECGYTIHDRLLRPARVGIAKGGVPENGTAVDTQA